MISEPPLSTGALKVTVACVLPDVAVIAVGGFGTRVIVIESFKEVEIFPAESFVQAYNVLFPRVVKVYVVGAFTVQPASPTSGVVADSVNKYPETEVSSVAVKVEISTVKEWAVDGIVKAVTVGVVESRVMASSK